MNSERPDFGPELLQLAQKTMAMLDPMLDPLVTALTAAVSTTQGEPGKCQQVWCPVCAIVAVASGEQHPLHAVITEHLAALQVLLHAPAYAGGADSPDEREARHRSEPRGRYQHIPVTIDD